MLFLKASILVTSSLLEDRRPGEATMGIRIVILSGLGLGQTLLPGAPWWVVMGPTFSAYRIHVSRNTVQTLLSLDEGYKIDVRGQTELKVGVVLI